MTPEGERRKREVLAEAFAETDPAVLRVCRLFGHRYEGRVVTLEPGELRVAGRCQLCGVGVYGDA